MGIIKIYNFKDKVKTWVNKRPAFQSSTEVTKINIKLKSFDLHELNEASKAITTIVTDAGAVLSGPIPLPMKKKIYCVLRSPHVNKDSREHFEIRTHSRLFEIVVKQNYKKSFAYPIYKKLYLFLYFFWFLKQ